MIQYILGRKHDKLQNLSSNGVAATDKLFFNDRIDARDWNALIVNHSTFLNMGLRKHKFKNCDFQHCIFIDCYFKHSNFDNVNFTASKFINCNFDEIALSHCKFEYTTFHGCFIDFDIMHYNLPTGHNLRWKMCINLGMESLKAGNTKEYQKYFFEEKKASEKHYWGLICQEEKYYKEKYGLIDRWRGLKWLIASKFNRIIWGYGERLINICVVSVVTIFTFAIIYFNLGSVYKTNDQVANLTFFQAFYHSRVCQ
jgi:hypothetical protein